MKNKSIFLLIACVCGTIAAVGVSQWMQAQGTGGAGVETVEIFVTAKSIDVTEEITADKIRLESWPADRVPEGTTSNLEDLDGKFAAQRFYPGEPVMPAKLMDESTASSRIPSGFTVVSMRADTSGASSNLLQPGDRVNVVAYFSKNDIIPETVAKTVLSGVRVYAVDGRKRRIEDEEEAKPARSISLLIHQDDTEAWTYATELGKIRLMLGNATDYKKAVNGPSPAGQSFLKWLHDKSEKTVKTAPSQTALAVEQPVAPKVEKKTFKTVKIHNGVLTEYIWTDGESVPLIRVVGDEELEAVVDQEEPVADDQEYLNGPDSPFYEPTEEAPAN